MATYLSRATIKRYGARLVAGGDAPHVSGIVADSLVTVVSASWIGANAVELVYRTAEGELGSQIL